MRLDDAKPSFSLRCGIGQLRRHTADWARVSAHTRVRLSPVADFEQQFYVPFGVATFTRYRNDVVELQAFPMATPCAFALVAGPTGATYFGGYPLPGF